LFAERGAAIQADKALGPLDASSNHALSAKLGGERPTPLGTLAALGANRGLTDRALVVDVRGDNVASRSGE
jgi:hypothetical protein